MSELFKEIEADMRAERMQSQGRKLARMALYISVAVVAGTAAGVVWKNYKESNHQAQTHLLMQASDALAKGDQAKADAAFAELSKGSAQWGIAMLQKAQKSDQDAAAKIYKELAAETNDAVKPFADIAKLKLMAAGEAVEAGKDSPFALSLAEAKAWNLAGQGKNDEAAKLFAGIARDDKAPADMRQRATLAVQQLAPATLEAHD